MLPIKTCLIMNFPGRSRIFHEPSHLTRVFLIVFLTPDVSLSKIEVGSKIKKKKKSYAKNCAQGAAGSNSACCQLGPPLSHVVS
jgi:hypothetical protein